MPEDPAEPVENLAVENPPAEHSLVPPKLPLYLKLIAPGLRLFFKLLYHQFAWTYDLVAATVSIGMWNGWVRSVVPFIAGPRVLELGHGPGHLQLAMHPAGRTGPGETAPSTLPPIQAVFGLDRSPQMGRIARGRLIKAARTPALVNGSALSLPFASGSLQTIVATFPTEYIIHPDTLAEAYRALCPGGRFVVLAGAWITGGNLLQRAAALLFKVTGQAPDWEERALAPAVNTGFEMQLEWIDLPSSRVVVAVGTKPVL